MTTVAPNTTRVPMNPPVGETVWGLDVAALHDRVWASRCVQVIRCGSRCVVDTGPQLYLLLDADILLMFNPGRLLERLRWLKPKSVRLRLTDRTGHTYEERVVADGSGKFSAIRRVYRAKTHAIGRAWLTENRQLAGAWSQAASLEEGNRMMKSSHEKGTLLPWRDTGTVFGREDADRLRRVLLRTWQDPRRAVDSVYAYEPGVWVHESVSVPPGVRFVPPVWVGAGNVLRPGQVVVGPAVMPDAQAVVGGPAPIDWRDVLARPALLSRPGSMSRLARSGKRFFDIAFSTLALIATLPIYPVIMATIAIEDGRPWFFAHRRQTLGGREFPCFKFRTMVKNAERIKAQLAAANVCDGAHFYIENDPRVTKVGRVLRKFHLDELPQFWNVLVGHMSVVGPRPSPDKENQYCPAWREARLSVRPGVTGLWQVRRTRAAATDFQEWVRYDLEYVHRQSFALDIRIIVDTIRQIIHR